MKRIKSILSRVLGIRKYIKIDFSFLIIFILALVLNELVFYLLFVIFILLHELAHFVVAKKLGYMPDKVKLTFFGASLEGFDDFIFSDEIKVVLAGPIFNFFVCVFCYLMFWFFPESYIYLSDVLMVNMAIFLFNILPIFPLDFGRFILACLSIKHDRKNALKTTKYISFAVIVFLICVFILSFFFEYNFAFGCVCLHLLLLFFDSSKGASYKRSIFIKNKHKFLKKGLPERVFYFDKNVSHFALLKKIDSSSIAKFIFLDENNRVVSTMLESELLEEFGL